MLTPYDCCNYLTFPQLCREIICFFTIFIPKYIFPATLSHFEKFDFTLQIYRLIYFFYIQTEFIT